MAEQIISLALAKFNLSRGVLLSRDSDSDVTMVRSIVWYFLKQADYSYREIGEMTGGWPASTVQTKVKRMEEWKVDPVRGMSRLMKEMEEELNPTTDPTNDQTLFP